METPLQGSHSEPASAASSPPTEEGTLELQQALRFCGSTLLRGLTSAARKVEAGHLHLLFEELAVRHAVAHTTLLEQMDDPELAPSPHTLATLGWLAARGCLPDGDEAIVKRCRELAHDLLVRCEELLQGAPPSGFNSVLRGYAEATRQLRDRLAAHEPRE